MPWNFVRLGYMSGAHLKSIPFQTHGSLDSTVSTETDKACYKKSDSPRLRVRGDVQMAEIDIETFRTYALVVSHDASFYHTMLLHSNCPHRLKRPDCWKEGMCKMTICMTRATRQSSLKSRKTQQDAKKCQIRSVSSIIPCTESDKPERFEACCLLRPSWARV